jgi:hypothetical protein
MKRLVFNINFVILFLISGCVTSYYLSPEMRITCDSLKYSPKNITEISAQYPDSKQSIFYLTISKDSTFTQILYSDIGPPFQSIILGRCSLNIDTLKLIPLKFGSEDGVKSISDSLKIKFFNTYQKRNFYLIRKINSTIYLVRPSELEGFCQSVIEHNSKSDYFHINCK